MKNLEKFINDQLSRWPLACENFRSIRNVETRTLDVGGLEVVLQHNPARIISSAAKLDPSALKARKCFLCRENRPLEQSSLKFEGRKGKKYDILVNPYPIFANHLVIAMEKHCDQSIWRRYVDMLDLSRTFQKYIFFYNGPECGASAPDHHHFQAALRGQMPLERAADDVFDRIASGGPVEDAEYISSVQDAEVYRYCRYIPGVFLVRAGTSKSAAKMFYRLVDCAPVSGSRDEPLMNLFSWYCDGEYRAVVVFRSRHRSRHYYSDGPDHLTMSPGCADMAGYFIVPVREDFDKLDASLLSALLEDVCLSREDEKMIVNRLTRVQPEVSVGIMSGKEIIFEILTDGAGPRKAVYREGKIEYDGAVYDELFFEARTLSTMFAEPSFMLYGVTIGVDFHWERKEEQKFAGALKIIVENNMLTAVNVIGVEDYLVSVISSEMKSTASLEFLKAHSVISRSWLMSIIRRRDSDCGSVPPPGVNDVPSIVSYADSMRNCGDEEGEHIKWYDKDDHRNFDVCADDHCQRYQGLTRAAGDAVRKAVDATWGQVLSYEGEICDARFSKCCGGIMEKFSSCWEDRDHDYLEGLPDTPGESGPVVDMTEERAVRAWIDGGGKESFCGNATPEVLSQVLNPYDMETADFFRWKVRYGRDELSEIIQRRTRMDLGEINALIPLQRGTSGRIVRLRISGSGRSVVIGKELEIRRSLSETHLKSSAFVVDYEDAAGNVVPSEVIAAAVSEGKRPDFEYIVLKGAGWGHGVGLCQIGAAVMSTRGYDYSGILRHYYPGASVIPLPEMKKREIQ